MEKYQKVLDLMKRKGGRLMVADMELAALLGVSQTTGKDMAYRISVYMSYIRRYAKLAVKTVRSGRRAVAYELVEVDTFRPLADNKHWQASRYARNPSVQEAGETHAYDL